MMRTTNQLSWEPIRRGSIYCAPACGHDCTWKEYQVARRAAAALATTLDNGWEAEVHENLGWHWNVRWGTPGYGMVLYQHAPHSFMAGIESKGLVYAMTYSAVDRTPRKAIEKVVRQAQSDRDAIDAIIQNVLRA